MGRSRAPMCFITKTDELSTPVNIRNAPPNALLGDYINSILFDDDRNNYDEENERMRRFFNNKGMGDPRLARQLASFANDKHFQDFGFRIGNKPLTKLEQLPQEFLLNMAESLKGQNDEASVAALKIIKEAQGKQKIAHSHKNKHGHHKRSPTLNV